MSPRALFRHQVTTLFCLPAKRVDCFSFYFFEVFYAKNITWLLFDMRMLSHLRCMLFSLFFCHLEYWEPEKCHASLPSSCLFSADVLSSQPGYFGFVTIPCREEGCFRKYAPPPPLPPPWESRDLPNQGFCTPRPHFFSGKYFLFFSFPFFFSYFVLSLNPDLLVFSSRWLAEWGWWTLKQGWWHQGKHHIYCSASRKCLELIVCKKLFLLHLIWPGLLPSHSSWTPIIC